MRQPLHRCKHMGREALNLAYRRVHAALGILRQGG